MSQTIRNDVIAELGDLHYGRKRIQPAGGNVRAFYEKAEQLLQHPLLEVTRADMQHVGEAFEEVVRTRAYTCYACAIMPHHVHLLIRKHRDQAEEMIGAFQEASRLRLRGSGLRAPTHPVWGGGGWKVFLDHPEGVRRTIRYIEDNPRHMGLPSQHWVFVKEYDGWPLHPGHSPNSPYARAMRAAGQYHR